MAGSGRSRAVSALLALTLVLALPLTGAAEPTPESQPQHTPYLQGFEDGTFRANEYLTRAQSTAILVRLGGGYDPQKGCQSGFSDVTLDDWYGGYVALAQKNGLVIGYPDGTFLPNKSVTRAEFAAMLCNYFGLDKSGTTDFPDAANHWAAGAIGILEAQGAICGYADGTYRPDAPISRAEAVKLLNGALERTPDPKQTGAYLAAQPAAGYPDLLPAHWAYYDILEATVPHGAEDFHS